VLLQGPTALQAFHQLVKPANAMLACCHCLLLALMACALNTKQPWEGPHAVAVTNGSVLLDGLFSLATYFLSTLFTLSREQVRTKSLLRELLRQLLLLLPSSVFVL